MSCLDKSGPKPECKPCSSLNEKAIKALKKARMEMIKNQEIVTKDEGRR